MAALCLNIRLEWVELQPQPLSKVYVERENWRTLGEIVRPELECFVTYLYAGWAAEKVVLRHDSIGATSDFEMAALHLNFLTPVENCYAMQAVVEKLQNRAIQLIEENKQDVETLAGALLAKGRLDFGQIQDVLNR